MENGNDDAVILLLLSLLYIKFRITYFVQYCKYRACANNVFFLLRVVYVNNEFHIYLCLNGVDNKYKNILDNRQRLYVSGFFFKIKLQFLFSV